MRRVFGCAIAMIAASAALSAAPACVTQTLNSYITAGAAGCDIGSFNFSHFDWLIVTAGVNVNNVDPSNIVITPHDNGLAGPSLDVDLNWHTSNGILTSVAVSTLAFRVLANDPTNFLLSSSHLNVDSSFTGLLGTAAVTESNCVGGLFTGNLCLAPGAIATSGLVGVGGLVDFGAGVDVVVAPFNAPVSQLDVLKTFSILTPALSTATLTSVTESFGISPVAPSSVPEPATWLLLTTGFVLLAARKLRFVPAA
jgi:hypothetical protein